MSVDPNKEPNALERWKLVAQKIADFRSGGDGALIPNEYDYQLAEVILEALSVLDPTTEKEWGVRSFYTDQITTMREMNAYHQVSRYPQDTIVSRLVGPWVVEQGGQG